MFQFGRVSISMFSYLDWTLIYLRDWYRDEYYNNLSSKQNCCMVVGGANFFSDSSTTKKISLSNMANFMTGKIKIIIIIYN